MSERLPGSLSSAQLYDDPGAADQGNVAQRWGRDYDLHHLGLQMRSQLAPHHRIEISPYVQYRDIDHPIFQVIAQVSRDYGLDARYENDDAAGGTRQPVHTGRSAGLAEHVQPAVRERGWKPRRVDQESGRPGRSVAVYAENVLSLTPRLTAVVGGRLDRSIRKSRDLFLSNGDQSDRRVYSPLLPKVGFLYAMPKVDGQFLGTQAAATSLLFCSS